MTRNRLIAAGFTTSAVATAMFAAAPAAQAVPLTTLTPAAGPTGVTLTATLTAAYSGAAVGAIFTTDASCPASYPASFTTTTTLAATSATKVDANSITFGVPATLPLGTNGVPKAYAVCTYTGASATALTTLVGDATKTFTVVPSLALTPGSGPAGGGTAVTGAAAAAAPFLTAVTAPGVAFNANACPTEYGGANGTGNLPASSVTKGSTTTVTATTPTTLVGTGSNTKYNVCVYDGATNTSVLIATGAKPFEVMLPGLSLSPAVGPSAGLNSITANAPNDFLLGVTTPGAVFTTATTCPATYPSGDTAYNATGPVQAVIRATTALRKVSDSRLAVTLPAVPLINSLPTGYLACFYNGTTATTSTLVGTAPYLSTTVPTLSSVVPAAGSALGGDKIVVTGTGLPTAPGSITATLGGFPLNVTPVSPTAFTATTPMHAAESGLPLIITTAAGTTKLQNAFSYLNTIATMPNTAPNTKSLDVSVKGVGFFSANFGSNATDAKIYLVDGVYDPTLSVTSGNKVRAPSAECTNVLVITDNELICSLDLRSRLNQAGAAVAVADANAHNATAMTTVIGSRYVTGTGPLSFSDEGLPITGTGIPAGTVITKVLSTTEATLSKAAIAAGTVTLAIGGPMRTVATVTTTGTNTVADVTAPAGSFQPDDVGLTVTDATNNNATVIAANTKILSVTENGGGARLSINAVSASTITIALQGTRVPTGAYNLTFVSNGATSANTTDANYSQSVVSSGSTFTVSPF